jgi:hypothetical protein
LLQRIRSSTPDFFDSLVIRLLIAVVCVDQPQI